MFRKLVIISLLSILLIMVTGIGGFASEKGVVYYLSPNQFDEMQTSAAAMIKDSMEDAGYTCNIMVAGNEDVNLQMNQMENAISQNPKAIIVAAVDGTAICAGVNKARDAGIPVIAYDRTISACSVDFTVNAGTKIMGIMAAQETIDLLKDKYGEVKGSVLDIMGDPGDSYTNLIEEGFREVMEGYPDVKIETKVTYGWEASTAANIADDYLLAYPDTDLIFAHADHMAAAIASVLETNGYAKGDIFLIGTAGMPMGLQLIREGWINATIEYSPQALAEGIAMFIDDIINKNEIELGSYEVMGISANLTEQTYGLEMKFDGSVVDAKNVDDPSLWGNQVK